MQETATSVATRFPTSRSFGFALANVTKTGSPPTLVEKIRRRTGELRMKCEMCNYQQKPDNLQMLVNQAETCERKICRTAKIVWRDGQMTLTTSPMSDEMTFNATIRDLPAAEPPPLPVLVTKGEVDEQTTSD
jgi:hypothetical protein